MIYVIFQRLFKKSALLREMKQLDLRIFFQMGGSKKNKKKKLVRDHEMGLYAAMLLVVSLTNAFFGLMLIYWMWPPPRIPVANEGFGWNPRS